MLFFAGGNVATNGITADLEAIAGAGIGGIQLFHGQFGGPWPGVTPQIECLSPAWDDAINHAAKECRRLGLNFEMENRGLGNVRRAVDHAGNRNAQSRLVAHGCDRRSAHIIPLPKPQPSNESWRNYREVAVVAFPTPKGDTAKPLIPISVKSNRQDLPWDKSLGASACAGIHLDPNREGTWVEASFADEVTVRTVEFPSVMRFNHGWSYEPGVKVKIEAVLNGGLKPVAQYDMPQSNWTDDQPMSLACPEVSAKTYRITIVNKHPMDFSYVHLFSAARKHNWEFEAGWTLRSWTAVLTHLSRKRPGWTRAGSST